MLVLVVEDDIAIRECIKDALEYSGYTVAVAENGQVALNFLALREENKPCLIILDLMMPVMDGWQFMDFALNDPKLASIPIVIVSAIATLGKPIDHLNVKAVIKKPLSLSQLLETVEKFCGSGKDCGADKIL